MKMRILLATACIVTLVAFFPPPASGKAAAQEPQPGDPVVTGSANLARTVSVFPYDVDIYGIYLIEGDQMTPVTSVAVEHVNVDRVSAKLSPDGLKVAYLVEFGGTGFSKLVIVGFDGLNSQVLFESDDPGRYITTFAWSHDSSQVAYSLSRDPFGDATTGAGVASFDDPDAEWNPEEETPVDDDPLALTGEVWVTDLNGDIQEQIVEQGAMDVLGWTSDDTGLFFTRITTDTLEPVASSPIEGSRALTPTTASASGVALVQLTDAAVSNLLTNTIPFSDTDSVTIYTDFYLLEGDSGEQKLAVVSTGAPFSTMPYTDTTLSLMDLGDLTLTPILTSSDSIVGVSASPDGSRLAYVTEQTGALWVADANGLNHTEVVTGGLASDVVWGNESNMLGATSLSTPRLQIFDLSGTVLGSVSALPSNELEAEPLGAYVVRQLSAPYVHQVWDTPNWFGGYCACGPTSAAMALAFYNRISAHPIQISKPYLHTNNYGFYVAEKYSLNQTRWAWDCDSGLVAHATAYGLYGFTMVSATYRAAEYSRIRDAIHRHGLSTTQDWTPTFNEVRAAIDRGHLVIIGTKLTRGGHVVLIKGYTSDGRIVVHDPFGNFRKGSYGQYNGADGWYYWNDLSRYGRSPVFNFIEVHGTPPSNPPPPPKITHWKGEYFNNRTLSGRPTVVRNDTSINFNWGGGSPASGIPSDNFSARWTRTMRFERGVYRFRVVSDDGARLYVDGRRILNVWWDQAPTNYYADIYLRSGNHTLKLEYYEHGGGAYARMWWSRIGTWPSWAAEYYNNRYLSGGPTFTRNEYSIYHNWGYGGPGNGVGNDNFSARWRGNVWVPGGAIRFFARTDDGVRLWVDNGLTITRWRDQPSTTSFRSRTLNRGWHSVRMDYYEHAGRAYARMWYQPVFRVEYYNNRYLSGRPKWTGYNSRVDYVWGYGSPNSRIPGDNFSARWTATQYFSGGRYWFCTRTDDGVRLYVDGARIINRWHDQASRTYCASRTMAKGYHNIKMEYYEHGGWARARLRWGRYGSTSNTGSTDFLALSNEEPPAEADVLALYGDAGYLGPLTEADVGAEGEEAMCEVFLPLVIR